MQVQIHGAGSAMQGVGRAADGRAVFVPGALPGEAVEVEIVRDKGSFLQARLVRVIDACPERAEPPCPHAGACGGCAAMHMTYDAGLQIKQRKVYDALSRVGGVEKPEVLPTLEMENPFRARNKAEYAIAQGKIGLRYEGSREIMEVEDCLTQNTSSIAATHAVRSWLARYPQTFTGYLVTRVTRAGDVMCVLCADGAVRAQDALVGALYQGVPGMKSMYTLRLNARHTHALDGQCTWVSGEKTLWDDLLGLSFRLQPQSFFQVNPVMAEKLYEAAISMARLTGEETVMDAYCGAGTIALCMAQRARRVEGIEIVVPAIEDARENVRHNGMQGRAAFHLGDAAVLLPRMLAGGLRPDVVVVDPPRKGIDEKLAGALVHARIDRLVYISCDPATFARDVKRLTPAYRLALAQPVDMFPWSAHVETVALLHREDA